MSLDQVVDQVEDEKLAKARGDIVTDGTTPFVDDEKKVDTPNLETEGEETEDEKAEREAAEAAEKKKAQIRIPKARLDEVTAKHRQREQALIEEVNQLKNRLEGGTKQTAVSQQREEIKALEDKYEDLLLDGQKDEARKVRHQISDMREALVEFQTSVKSDAARKAAVDELTYNQRLANLEAQYPELNPDHDEFNEEKTDETVTLLNAFIGQGMKRAEALAKAVKYVFGAAPTKTSEEKPLNAVKNQRDEDARRKAYEASKKQPSQMSKVGSDSDKKGRGGEAGIDVMNLTQKQFGKLDEETKAKLRGDEL